jgi:hypothetical protein
MKRGTAISLLLVVLGGGWLVWRAASNGMPAPWTVDGFWIWIAAAMTLGILSFLAGDNPFYKFTENLFVGVSAAYWMVVGFWSTIVPNLLGKLAPGWVARNLLPGLAENGEIPPPEWFYLVPLGFGICLLWRLVPAGSWISRWPLALILGTTAGLRLIGFLVSDFVGQIRNTMKPLLVRDGSGAIALGDSLSNTITVLAVVAGLVYFFFSKEHKGFFGRTSRVGVWVLMVTFGAGFGYTVMGRISLLVGRFEFLLYDWLRIGSR